MLPRSGSIGAIVEHALAAAEAQHELNAYLELFHGSAREKAAQVEVRMKAGDAGPLAGMVFSIKDNICYKGHKVSASSRILEGFTSLYSATAVERLLAADAVIDCCGVLGEPAGRPCDRPRADAGFSGGCRGEADECDGCRCPDG